MHAGFNGKRGCVGDPGILNGHFFLPGQVEEQRTALGRMMFNLLFSK